MKKQTSLITLSLMLATPALAGGGGAPAAQPAPAPAPAACRSIAQIVAGDPNFSTLLTAAQAAGLVETLASGEYTVFAPTNAAFAKLPSDTLAAALNDTEMLRAILLYHVVPGKVTSKDVMSSSTINTVQGSATLVTVTGNKVMVDNAGITRADMMACNGVIHVIDTVLMPAFDVAEAPAAEEPMAEAPAAEAPAAEAAPDANFEEMVSQETEVVDPAPAEEEPMAEEPAAEAPAATAAPAAVSILTIPALPLGAAQTSTEASAEASTETAEGAMDASAEASGTELSMEGNTLYDVIVADDNYSTFRDLLSDAGITEVLMSNEYTIFAPTNAAFEAMDQDVLARIASDPAVLQDFLLYYIVTGKVNDEMMSGAQLRSLQGSSLDVAELKGSSAGATIDSAANGLIFPVNKVFIAPNLKIPAPPAEPAATEPAATTTTATTTTATTTTVNTTATNVVTLLQGQAQFSTLLDLITRAGLADALNTGDVTIFAPTNDAFAKVPKETMDALAADANKLKAVLLFHVVSGRVVDAGLNVAQLRSMEGSSIDLKMNGTALMVGTLAGDVLTGGTVTVTPLTVGNSVIYPVDAVIIPPSLK